MTLSTWFVAAVSTFLLLLVPVALMMLRGAHQDTNLPRSKDKPKIRIQVLVLGDIGRSPRMQNHALSLVKYGATVDLIGYVESELHPNLLQNQRVYVHPIAVPPKFLQTGNGFLFLLCGPLKVLYQLWSLWIILAYKTKPGKWLIVQNPPSIPTLLVAALVCWFRGTKFAIDWHNFGYSILALKLGWYHPLVRLSRSYERHCARYADLNFTVSEAMSRKVKKDFAISAPLHRLYDRPSPDFKPASEAEKTKFIRSTELTSHFHGALPSGDFKILVSSTSWTPDEDFSILLTALVAYSRLSTTSRPELPELIVVITGKGPQKELYLRKILQLQLEGKLKKVTIQTAWLPTYSYAKLLASADIGISLHQSSSGVDLPMKVVDMFGAGLPVVGWGAFEAWPELVKDGINGRSFGSVKELQNILIQLVSDNGQQLAKLREGVLREQNHGWDEEWRQCAGQAFDLVTAT